MKIWPGLLLFLLPIGCAEAPAPRELQPQLHSVDSLPRLSVVAPFPDHDLIQDTTTGTIVFAASWCLPCRRQIDALRDHPPLAVYFLDDLPSDSISSWVDTTRTSVVTGRSAQQLADTLGGIPGLPTTLILERGTIRHRITGFRTDAEIKELVTSR